MAWRCVRWSPATRPSRSAATALSNGVWRIEGSSRHLHGGGRRRSGNWLQEGPDLVVLVCVLERPVAKDGLPECRRLAHPGWYGDSSLIRIKTNRSGRPRARPQHYGTPGAGCRCPSPNARGCRAGVFVGGEPCWNWSCGLPQHERHDGVVETTFRGALVRSVLHNPLPWSRMAVGPDEVRLEPCLADAVEFRRQDVRHIVVERHRGPFAFRTLIWIVTSKRHTHAFVAFRTKRLVGALMAEGWPVTEQS